MKPISIIKRSMLLVFLMPALAFAQTYPAPTFSNLTLTSPLTAANGGTGTTTSTGTGNVVLSTSPVLVTPSLGTPTSLTLTNATGLPLSTGVTGILGVTSGGTGSNTSTGSGSVVLSTSPSIASPTITGTSISGGGIITTAGTNTGTPQLGLVNISDSTWSPSGSLGQYNNYFNIGIPVASLTGGTVAQRWAAADNLMFIDVTTSGPPTGTPSTPTGMADSHTGAYNGIETIPAGLCDGQDGNGFTGPGGSPGNNCYQEIGGFENTSEILSPGHYGEGVGLTFFDHPPGGGTAVDAKFTGVIVGIYKNQADNTYSTNAFVANSVGTQQTADSPTAVLVANGGWLYGVDFSGVTYSGFTPIRLPGNQTITSDSGSIYLNAGGSTDLAISSTAMSTTVPYAPPTTGGIIGTTLGDNANAGSDGEYQTSFTGPTSLTTATSANAASVSLTAGDWNVWCAAQFVPAGTTTVSALTVGVSSTSATIGAYGNNQSLTLPFTTGATQVLVTPVRRLNSATAFTAYCVTQASFGVSTMAVNGTIYARRVR